MHLLGIVYEVVFIVKMKDNKDQCNIWNHSVTLNIILPHSKTLTRPENLSDKCSEEWILIQMDEFKMSAQNVGERWHSNWRINFSPHWKSGLVVNCAQIRPKNY